MVRIDALTLSLQAAVLAALAATVGLGPAGWVVGAAYGAVVAVALAHGLGPSPLGPADRVTLARSTLVGGVTALTADSWLRPAPVPVLITLATVALVLDAVDGLVARRTGTASGLGARFDMEVDAFLLLVLSVYVAPTHGAWVLAIGAMRYAFVAAGWVLPWMRRRLPARYWRKVVAATQGIVLVVVAADVLPGGLEVDRSAGGAGPAGRVVRPRRRLAHHARAPCSRPARYRGTLLTSDSQLRWRRGERRLDRHDQLPG